MTPDSLKQIQAVPAGFLELDLFNEIARLSVLVALELVPLRLNANGDVEVLLTQRSSTDPFWPSLHHTPGTILRPSDLNNSLITPQERLLADELSGIELLSSWNFRGVYLMNNCRGKAFGLVHWIEVGSSPIGSFYSVQELPDTLISGFSDFIGACAETFSSYKKDGAHSSSLDIIQIAEV